MPEYMFYTLLVFVVLLVMGSIFSLLILFRYIAFPKLKFFLKQIGRRFHKTTFAIFLSAYHKLSEDKKKVLRDDMVRYANENKSRAAQPPRAVDAATAASKHGNEE